MHAAYRSCLQIRLGQYNLDQILTGEIEGQAKDDRYHMTDNMHHY
jgi:hypothetical protein